MYACCDHVAPLRTNTYTAPAVAAVSSDWFPFTPVAALPSDCAPTAIVSPETPTEHPK